MMVPSNWRADPRVIQFQNSSPNWDGEFSHLPDTLRAALESGTAGGGGFGPVGGGLNIGSLLNNPLALLVIGGILYLAFKD